MKQAGAGFDWGLLVWWVCVTGLGCAGVRWDYCVFGNNVFVFMFLKIPGDSNIGEEYEKYRVSDSEEEMLNSLHDRIMDELMDDEDL
jgi:hypothetical protein